MSMEHPFIGAYWSSRKESRDECAARILTFLQSIAQSPEFGQWFFKKRNRNVSLVPLTLQQPGIAEKLKTNNKDTDRTVIEELGFSLNVWNGNEDAPASFSVTCGAFSDYMKNSAVLCFPPRQLSEVASSLQDFESLLRKSIQAWDPDDAVVTSSELISRAGGGLPSVIGGWFVYRRGSGIDSMNL